MLNESNGEWKGEFVRLLEKSTVVNNLAAQAIDMKNTHLPEKVCRYRKDSTHSRSDLKEGTVWLSARATTTTLLIARPELALLQLNPRLPEHWFEISSKKLCTFQTLKSLAQGLKGLLVSQLGLMCFD